MQKYLLLVSSLLVIGFTSLLSVPGSPFLIGDMTQADISAKYPTPITPAGFTFSIWSLIYLSWIVAWVYIAFFDKKKHRSYKSPISWFSIAMLLTALWLVPWWYERMWVALLTMILILITLWHTYFWAKQEHWIFQKSVELTMGWIHIATFANIAVWLKYIGAINIESSIIWWIGILSIAFFATLIFQLKYHAHIVSLVFLWASIGIYFGQSNTIQTYFVIFYAIIILIWLLFSQLRK